MNSTEKYLDQVINTPCINQGKAGDLIDKIEIVVPTFNAIDAVKRCLDALILHTSKRIHITLLDDASTNIKLINYLSTIAKKHSHIKLIKRKSNLGYLHNETSA